MKPIANALFGAVIVGGGLVSLAAPAFAEESSRPMAEVDGMRATAGGSVRSEGSGHAADTCKGHGHAHASTCTCEQCSAAGKE